MQIITFKTTIILAAASIGLSSLACAEQTPSESQLAHDMAFVKADSDQNGVLTRAEFESFVAFKAAQNVGNYPVVQEKALEHAIFSAKDLNGDGLLTARELAEAASVAETEQDAPPAEASPSSDDTAQEEPAPKSHGS